MSSPSKATTETPLTITSLLASLHSHLQSQTELLPTLHAQLGLPESALADELSTLQRRLADCVEQQIEGRQQEVDGWVKKCDDIEKEIAALGRALGSHSKVAGSGISELRKQHVLPVRHEMLLHHLEKLNKLYQSKLEQLSNLTSRLATLSKTLGRGFYALDILEHSTAPGEDPSNPGARRDVSPDRYAKLEKELVRGKTEITRRLSQLSTTFLQIDWLYTELEIPHPSIDDELSSSLSIPQMPRSLSSPADPFLCSVSSATTPTPLSRVSQLGSAEMLTKGMNHSSQYARIFSLFVIRVDESEAEGKSVEPGSAVGLEGVDPTLGLMQWADETKAELEDIKRRREAQIQTMYDELETLWKRLGISTDDIDDFVEAHRGSTEATVQAYELELERMMELKRESMSMFINNARAEIERLWNDLMVGEEERADFAPFADDEHTEELLTIHENEIKRLKEERRLKGPLLANIRKYFDICEEEKELAASASDQSRLLGRGPRDPGRLLREEKMRKRVSREKPRLEQELVVAIPAWEAEHDKPFLVNGICIGEVLMETVSANDKENARKNKPRAGSVPPRATTPSNSGPPKPSAVTPATRPGSSAGVHSQSVPNKRQKVTSGHGVSHSQRVPLGGGGHLVNGANHHEPQLASSHKAKTPSSSLPRPTSVSKSQSSYIPPVPALPPGVRNGNAYGAGIGLGFASTMHEQRSHLSSNASGRTMSLMSNVSAHSGSHGHAIAGRVPSGVVVTAAMKPRNSRRESFKPRPSIDNNPAWPSDGPRYAAFAGALREEDEY